MEIIEAKMTIANAIADDEELLKIWADFCTHLAIKKRI